MRLRSSRCTFAALYEGTLNLTSFRCSCIDRCIATDLGRKWVNVRTAVLSVVDTPAFEWMVLVLIFASSITLCFEDIYLDDNPFLKKILYWTNLGFCALFSIEMLLKWLALGFCKYFTSFWTILDFIIVFVSKRIICSTETAYRCGMEFSSNHICYMYVSCLTIIVKCVQLRVHMALFKCGNSLNVVSVFFSMFYVSPHGPRYVRHIR